MSKLINFSEVIIRTFNECTNLYGNILNYGIKFISTYEYIYKCAHELLGKRYIVKKVSEMLKDNIEVGKGYYFLSSEEKLEEQVALIIAFNLKNQVKELKRTIRFSYELYKKNKGTFFDEKFILLLNRQCGKLSINYEVFELFLIMFEYFHIKENLSYEKAIKISFRKIEMICPNILSKIFDGKGLSYESFTSLIKSKIKSDKKELASKVDFASLKDIYMKYKS